MVQTKNTIWYKIMENDYNPTEFILNDGTKAIVNIIYFGDDTPSLEKINGFTIIFQGLQPKTVNNIHAVAYLLNNIFNLRRKSLEQKEALSRYYEEHELHGWDARSIRIYTNAHKKIYGFSPKHNKPGVSTSPWDIIEPK